MDFITRLPPSRSRCSNVVDAILVIVDRALLSHYVNVTKDLNAKGFANVLDRELISRYGAP